MDYNDYYAASIRGLAGSGQGPVPRPGQNREFDAYCDEMLAETVMTGDEPEDFVPELRRAAWATWRTAAPTSLGGPSAHRQEDEDEELARVLALSAQEHQDHQSRQVSPTPGDDGEDDEDEQLRRAIAASEEEARAPKRQKREETPEEERRQLEEAMAASLAAPGESVAAQESTSDDEERINAANAEFQASREAFREEERRRRADRIKVAPVASATPETSLPTPPPSTTTPVPATTANGPSKQPLFNRPYVDSAKLSDRAQMEQERLARQAARNAQLSGSNPAGSSSTQGVSTSQVTPLQASAGPSRATCSTSQSSAPRHPLQAPGPFPSDAAGEYYPDGELRNSTLTIGQETSERTFDARDVIGRKSQISLIIMCSFVIDNEWLDTILPPPDEVPTIVIRPHPRENHPAWNGKVQAQPTGDVYCYPRMVGDWGSAHMKFFWIFYKTGRLRVAIMSANMVKYDWEWIENTIFVQDFLPLTRPVPLREDHLPHDLPKQFTFLFIHLKVHKALKYLIDMHPAGKAIPFSAENGFQDMERYDWSKVNVGVVMSIPGTYDGPDEMDKFGLCRLGRLLSDQGWKPKTGEKVVAEYQGSSLGQYGLDWTDLFYQFCCGKTSRQLLGHAKPKTWPPVEVLYPSLATVDASHLGRDGGGTMFVGKAWHKVTQPLFHDANSKRGGVLMHAKVLVATFEPRERSLGFVPSPAKGGKRKAEDMSDEAEGVGGWVYTGSHNFSSAAWGTPNIKRGDGSMNIRNYELGIVFPLAREGARAIADRVAPYKRPARPYGPKDEPWDQKAHGVDANGGGD